MSGLASTITHVFVSYLLQPLSGNRFNIIALMAGAALPDVESLFYLVQAVQYCTTLQCIADWPSHMLFHSFLGTFLLIAPMGAAAALWLGPKKWKGWKLAYVSALAGGLLHALTDTVGHAASDGVQLLWPATTGFSANLPLGAEAVLDAAALLGLAIFIARETGLIQKLGFLK